MRIQRFTVVLALLPLMMMGSCKEAPETVQVTETRELTMWDDSGLPLVAIMPPEWRQVPSTQHRLVNYRFDKDGEVYLSNARGGVLPNVNRWLGQFGKPPVADINTLPTVDILGKKGVLVEATGRFGGGMGKPPREGAGLIGVVVDFGTNLLTVKMIGSQQSMKEERQRLIQYCENLRYKDAESSGDE